MSLSTLLYLLVSALMRLSKSLIALCILFLCACVTLKLLAVSLTPFFARIFAFLVVLRAVLLVLLRLIAIVPPFVGVCVLMIIKMFNNSSTSPQQLLTINFATLQAHHRRMHGVIYDTVRL